MPDYPFGLPTHRVSIRYPDRDGDEWRGDLHARFGTLPAADTFAASLGPEQRYEAEPTDEGMARADQIAALEGRILKDFAAAVELAGDQLLHAAMVARRRTDRWEAWLILGDSGVGKSTLTHLLIAGRADGESWHVASDDLTLLQRSDDGALKATGITRPIGLEQEPPAADPPDWNRYRVTATGFLGGTVERWLVHPPRNRLIHKPLRPTGIIVPAYDPSIADNEASLEPTSPRLLLGDARDRLRDLPIYRLRTGTRPQAARLLATL